MIITAIPQFGRSEQPLVVDGDTLIVGGMRYDFDHVAEGEPFDPPAVSGETLFISPVTRIDGRLHVSIIYHLDDTAAQDQPGAPWVLDVIDGLVVVPVARIPEPEAG
jgi:hypothetical protein